MTLANSTFYQRSRDLTDAVGAFQVQSRDNLLDNRFELRSGNETRIGDLTLRDDSNSGLIYRREFNQSIAANNHFGSTINAYDLTLDPSGKNPGDLLGLTGSNPAGGNGAWIGQPGVPQYSNYYGWLNLAAMYPAGHGLYAESLAPYTAESTWTTKTLFSQHNLRLGERVGLNIGASRSWIDARIDNPFVLAGGSDRRDSHNYRLFAFQVSPYVKPTENSTLYYTFDRSLAVNTGFFSNGLGWGSGSGANQLNPLAFQSLSVLHELGLKVEAIPDQLFMTLATFKQARDQSPDSNNNIARLIIKAPRRPCATSQTRTCAAASTCPDSAPTTNSPPRPASPPPVHPRQRHRVRRQQQPQPAALRALRRGADPRVHRQRLPRLPLRLGLWRRALRLVDQQLVPEPEQDGEGPRRIQPRPGPVLPPAPVEHHPAGAQPDQRTELRQRPGRLHQYLPAAHARTHRAGPGGLPLLGTFLLLRPQDTPHEH